jgi:hypothetical protein
MQIAKFTSNYIQEPPVAINMCAVFAYIQHLRAT